MLHTKYFVQGSWGPTVIEDYQTFFDGRQGALQRASTLILRTRLMFKQVVGVVKELFKLC